MDYEAAPFALASDEGERLVFGEVTVLIKASRETTGGAFTIFEEGPPLLHTPRHVHANEDGFFRALADADRAGVLGPDSYAAASAQYGITWLT